MVARLLTFADQKCVREEGAGLAAVVGEVPEASLRTKTIWRPGLRTAAKWAALLLLAVWRPNQLATDLRQVEQAKS